MDYNLNRSYNRHGSDLAIRGMSKHIRHQGIQCGSRDSFLSFLRDSEGGFNVGGDFYYYLCELCYRFKWMATHIARPQHNLQITYSLLHYATLPGPQ